MSLPRRCSMFCGSLSAGVRAGPVMLALNAALAFVVLMGVGVSRWTVQYSRIHPRPLLAGRVRAVDGARW